MMAMIVTVIVLLMIMGYDSGGTEGPALNAGMATFETNLVGKSVKVLTDARQTFLSSRPVCVQLGESILSFAL